MVGVSNLLVLILVPWAKVAVHGSHFILLCPKPRDSGSAQNLDHSKNILTEAGCGFRLSLEYL